MSDQHTVHPEGAIGDAPQHLARLALDPVHDPEAAVALLVETSQRCELSLVQAVEVVRRLAAGSASSQACRLLMDAAARCATDATLLLHHYVVDAAAMVVVVGELDADTAPRLHVLLDRLLSAGHDRITLDLTGLRFLSAAGISTLVTARSRCRVAGGQFTLRDPTPAIARVLAVCRIPER